uniref:Putative multicopper oxidase GMC1 n=1 Tax=Ciona intestinalis TaxID=7719 RepID=F6ZNP4_CIOIN|nr:putative multicopper oxidase GMC1 isoform X1 [Ciona intestinalis]|eukprot:XP_018667701.1 putative multicopper oxidase GMC1 isoform X1 [Ciona intestinalis]
MKIDVFWVLLFLVVAVNCKECSHTSPCTPLRGGGVFKEPTQFRSTNGQLDAELIVDIYNFTVDWLTVQRRLYNGEFPGPTFTVKQGDIFNLKLNNKLQQPDYRTNEENVYRFPNSTNIHTHGLHISSKVPQDNPFLKVPPNSTYDYVFDIKTDHPAGTYWYHPHLHGSIHFQNIGGLGGMLIVEDDPSLMSTELASVSCPDNCEHDVQILLQTFQYNSDEDSGYSILQREIHDYEGFRLNKINVTNSSQNLEEWLEDSSSNIKYMLVNGMLNPTMEMAQGQMKRFRIIDTGGLYAVALHIDNVDPNGASCTVKEIAMDGVYLDQPRDPWLGRSFLVAAGRVDWLVICPESGTYELRSTFHTVDHDSLGEHPSFNGTLMTLNVTGTNQRNSTLPTALPQRPDFVSDLRNVAQESVKSKYVVEVTPTDTLNREDYSGVYYRYRAEVDTVQEWYFTNTEIFTSHPIHMHVNHVQVISYNPYTGPYGVDDGAGKWKFFNQSGNVCTHQFKGYDETVAISPPNDALKYLGHDTRQAISGVNTLGYTQIGDWKDTVLIPPLGNITVRFKTDSFTGDVTVHCHLQGDADQGMVMVFEIVEQGQSLEANIPSNGSYPWACMTNNPIGQTSGNGKAMNPYRFYMLLLVLLTLLLVQ